MIVLVTGARGNLGRVLVPALRERGDEVRELDARIDGADIRRADDVARAVAGADAVVHAAALHGVHLGRWTPHDFWEVNVTGTFNVYAAKPPRVVLCSTMGVYGHSVDRPATITDESPVRPRDVYGLSKALSERIAGYAAAVEGTVSVALRLGMFVPETFERYGFRLLFGGVDDRDVADAVLRALAYDPPAGFEAMNVMAEVPFDDPDEFARAPEALLERHWPGLGALGLDVRELVWGATIWRSERARQALGWRPRYGFSEFLAALRRGDRDHYPFAELEQWGL